MSPALVWFRQDLRLADNPALAAAGASGEPVVCLYILDDETPGRWRHGGAARWWLHRSLETLSCSLAALGGRLVLRRGPAAEILPHVVSKTGAGAVFWNRCYEPHAVIRDTALKAELEEAGVRVESFNGSLIAEPWQIATASGTPYRVFTPFWRALRTRPVGLIARPPARLANGSDGLASDNLAAWALRPCKPDWAGGLSAAWTPGEAGAQARLDRFLAVAAAYPDGRDRPDRPATSRLSPHLHWGEISPRQVWLAVLRRADDLADGGEKFLSELGWREFAHHLLFHNPQLPAAPLDGKFTDFPWADDDAGFAAWTAGRTGIPIVDAGMRELWTTGWMHNRVRMVAASFLIKHLMIDWHRGQEWFWDTLVDADLANNAAGWQWVAGCGADAAPFFRIFNPVLQGEKFDPDGAYVRRFVPELAGLPARHIHQPWAAPREVLASARVRLGETYPEPIVDLKAGRNRALAAFKALGLASA